MIESDPAPFSPRYLTAYHPKEQAHCFVDILVIGGGIAGLRACLEIDPSLSILLVTKESMDQSSSSYAQGGIAGVLDSDDRFENHYQDTLVAGADLCDPEVVDMVIREAPDHIRQLIAWGTHFDQANGKLLLGREGGHSHNRVAHAFGDATGREIIRAMIDSVSALPNTRIWQHAFTLDLLTADGVCRGAIVHCQQRGRLLIWAKQTILCTGGAGQLYRETTNPELATGDGHAMAYRAGVQMADMEFMQFHPTVLYIAGSSRSLISEAVRGEGAILVDRNGYRFMPEYDVRAELAPRDIVSRAIVNQMEATQHSNVYLDLSQLDPDYVRNRFPSIDNACAKFGIDITRDRVPVRPGAHYMIGGVRVDRDARTSLTGLWAAGEVISSGLHGANRLASNSLLECLVYGAHAGAGASRAAREMPDRYQAESLCYASVQDPTEPLDLADIRNSLKARMWRSAGVRRNGRELADAADSIATWCRYVLPRQFDSQAGWELQNMLTVAWLIIDSSRRRQESRGVHQRTDFPESDDLHWHSRQVVVNSNLEGP
ncbi:MAG: L-aspartate oxidase [Pirellulales bacterium]|nr:L-aspartate oxidase [Pirellulales bacterium]